MKANNLTISIPNVGCDKKCPYCISKITGRIDLNPVLYHRNLEKVKTVIKNMGVTSILITGKGEPFVNAGELWQVLNKFQEYPLEVQTNGIILKKYYVEEVYDNNSSFIQKSIELINVLAFSFDSMEDFVTYGDLFFYLHTQGKVIRVTMNVTNALEGYTLDDMIGLCKEFHVKQFSLRDITYPENFNPYIGQEERQWIDENNNLEVYKNLTEYLFVQTFDGGFFMKSKYEYKYPVIRKLPFGATVLDIDGISFTYFDYCVQESANDEEIRSLIYQEDGHLYTSWSSKASIIF